MSKNLCITLEEILAKINQVTKRMKDAKINGDKVGYEIALKEYERLNKEYARILYEKREPTQVFSKRM